MPKNFFLFFARILLGAPIFLGLNVISAELPERFASVYRLHGSIVAVDVAAGSARDLKLGDSVNVGEQVRATPGGEAVLRTDDAGFIAIRPNAVFTMERFSAKGKPDDQFSLRILTGALRLVTGLIGIRKKESYQILTATATIGIRGTDHEPYVLSPELAGELQQQEGTYNKVNKGGTSLTAAGAKLSIDAGQVGFAPAMPTGLSRSLMTVLMPVLLERVPRFFVAGMFDAELDQLASQGPAVEPGTAGSNGPPASTVPAIDTAPAPQGLGPQTAQVDATQQNAKVPFVPSAKSGGTGPCRVREIAATWLEQLDLAVVTRSPQIFVDLFAPQAKVTAQVRDADGKYIDFVFSRNELAKSTFSSSNRLSQFETRRISVKATLAANSTPSRCNRIAIESIVLESGVRDGQNYRVESTEKFTIESTSGSWLAIDASTRQR